MKIQYQLDAPPVVKWLSLLSCLCGLCAMAFHLLYQHYHQAALFWAVWISLGGAVSYALTVLAMITTSFYTKPKLIKRILPQYFTPEQTHLLEIGIGSGLGAITLAQHNPAIKIDAIDIFNPKDHSNNSMQRCQQNLHSAQVAEQVTVFEADMRNMPFANDTFDAAFAILSIHNLANTTERHKALTEIIRVTKPGGKIVIIDFQCHEEYRQQLLNLGATHIKTSRHFISTFPFLKSSTAIILKHKT